MNRNSHSHSLLSHAVGAALLLLLFASHGCAHRRAGSSGAPKFGQSQAASRQADPFLADGSGGDAAGGSGSVAGNVPLSGRPSHLNFDSPEVRKDLFEPVYFAFDRYDLEGAELQKIKRVAHHLRSRSSGVIIVGHTDSLGTTEYNRNLGERRALAIRAALLQEGIASARVQTVSFGEDRPAKAGNDESSHTANRRAEFGLFESVSS